MMKGIDDDEGPESSLRKLVQTFGVLGYVILNKSGKHINTYYTRCSTMEYCYSIDSALIIMNHCDLCIF